MNGSTSPRVP